MSPYLGAACLRAVWPISPINAATALTRRRREFRSGKTFASPNRIRTDTRLVNNGDRKWAFWVILEKQPDRAAQVQLTYSSTSFAVDTYVDAGSRKVAFPHRGAMETGRRGRHWLRRRYSVHANCPFDSAARHGTPKLAGSSASPAFGSLGSRASASHSNRCTKSLSVQGRAREQRDHF